MNKKLLVGVAHADEEELAHLLEELSQYSPSSVGLEMPEDFRERAKNGIATAFFYDIAVHYDIETTGTDIHGLEDPEVFDQIQIIGLAKAVCDEHLSREQLEMELAHTINSVNPYMPPEKVKIYEKIAKRFESALEILDEDSSSEAIMQLFHECNAKRDVHLLEKILEEQPDIVIVGDAHACELKDKLPGYKHVTFYS